VRQPEIKINQNQGKNKKNSPNKILLSSKIGQEVITKAATPMKTIIQVPQGSVLCVMLKSNPQKT